MRGRSYAPRGRTPEVLVDHGRASLGLISAVTDKGELRWMVLDGAVKAPSLLRFQTTTCDASSCTAPGPCLGRTGQIAADAAMRAR